MAVTEEVVERSPHDYALQLSKEKKYDEAHAIWRDIIKKYSDQSKQNQKARFWLCFSLIKQQNWGGALLEILDAESLMPGDKSLPVWKAQVLMILKRPNAAAEAYKRALSLDPENDDLKSRLKSLRQDPENVSRSPHYFKIPTWSLRPEEAGPIVDAARKPTEAETSDDFWRIRNVQTVFTHLSWDLFGAEAMRHFAIRNKRMRVPALEAEGLHQGILENDHIERITKAFNECCNAPFDPDDTFPDYYFDPKVEQSEIRGYTSQFLHVSEALVDALEIWLSSKIADIENLVGHAWTVRQVWAHRMRVHEVIDTQRLSAVGWHVDGAPLSMKKIFIYLNGASRELGSTEFITKSGERRLLEGPPGTWAMFENSSVRHRAFVPRSGPRPVIELLVVPAFETTTRPEAHTINCGHPWYPWPSTTSEVDNVLPALFQRSALATRIHARLVGTARRVELGDLSLGIDSHYLGGGEFRS